jgi:hypothetical protein
VAQDTVIRIVRFLMMVCTDAVVYECKCDVFTLLHIQRKNINLRDVIKGKNSTLRSFKSHFVMYD